MIRPRIHSALSLIEPWATLMIIGPRKFGKGTETRSWATEYRGPFAIHASKKLDKDICREEPYLSVLREHFGRWDFLDAFRLGAIVGVAELLHCRPVEELSQQLAETVARGDVDASRHAANEIAFGNYAAGEGRYGFVCDYAVALPEPIPARGMLNFWRLTSEQHNEIARQLPNSGFLEVVAP